MANVLYPQGAAHIIGKSVKADMIGDTIKVLFYASTYNSANEFVSDLTGGSIVARSSALGGKTSVNGTLDANDITVSSVSGSAFSGVVLYKDDGVADSSSPLIAWFDVSTYTPNGGNVTVVFNASGLFSIA